MSFNFGSTNPQAFGTPNPAAGSITFGTPIAQPQPQPGGLFGTPASSVAPSLGFGAPISTAPNFRSIPASAGLSFGTPASTNLSFGTSGNQNLSFGAPTSTNLSFGSSASTNLSFGAPTSTNVSSFGTAATTVPNFGTPASTGLSFGTPASTNLNFGTPVASTGLTFGTTVPTVSSAASSFNFGATAPTLGGFGAQMTSAAPALGFGTPRTTGTLSFGTGTGTLGTSGTFGTTPVSTLGFALSNANQTTNLLGTSATTSTAPSGGLNFGFGAGTALGGIAANLGTFGTLTTKPTTITTVTAATIATSSVGLGGVATSTPVTSRLGGVAAVTTTAARAEISAKDQPLPNEILQTIEAFKLFMKQQEQYCSDISKVSIKEFKKVKEDIDSINNKLSATEKQLHSNKVTAEKLKYDTAKGLQQIEMAQRTHDTPPGLQYDNNAPLAFFIELVDSFEKQMQQIKLQIESTDKYVRNIGSATPLSSNDLSLGLRRLHDTFVALAGRLQSIHSQVEYHKEQYLNYRRFILRTDESETVTNVFERPTAESDALQIALRSIDAYHSLGGRLSGGGGADHPLSTPETTVSSGPTPFGTSLDQTNLVQVQHLQQMQQQQQHQQQQAVLQQTATTPSVMSSLGPPPPYPGTGTMFGAAVSGGVLAGSSATSAFGTPAGSLVTSTNPLGGFALSHAGGAFPLQKPPVGNKRGKP